MRLLRLDHGVGHGIGSIGRNGLSSSCKWEKVCTAGTRKRCGEVYKEKMLLRMVKSSPRVGAAFWAACTELQDMLRCTFRMEMELGGIVLSRLFH
jgi:hypothetical protein